jgi:phosphomannomutase
VIDEQFRLEVLDWIANDPDSKTASLLENWLADNNEAELRKSFNGFLEFGTAGLRGPVRPGPSGMNRAVVGRTAAAIADFLISRGLSKVVIGRDARHGSMEFAQESAEIFSGAGLDVYLLPRELPTPVLAFAVNELQMDCGIMVTASHNPAIDNGYKVYLGGSIDGVAYRGSQIIAPIDSDISKRIGNVKLPSPRGKNWRIIGEDLVEKYIASCAGSISEIKGQKIIYTAMHGVGTRTLLSVFKQAQFTTPVLVSEQSEPNPDFPTVAFPNPEEPGAMDLAISLAKNESADLVVANDPDADRCAVVAKDESGNWRMLRGDELGILLGHYIAKNQNVAGRGFATTIVSSSALGKIAVNAGANFIETLTGFKWLSKIENLAFGYEEAIGYCVDPGNVNDKDGISAALKIAQINSDLASRGSSIFGYLDEIWTEIGYHRTEQLSIRVDEISIVKKMISTLVSNPITAIAGLKVTSFEDLSKSLNPTQGLRIRCDESVRIIIRPSGTEPKLKTYIEVIGEKGAADTLALRIKEDLSSLFASYR